MPLKTFDTVTLVCDPVTIEHANAIRAVLETYRLQVHFVQLIQRHQAEEFFANPNPNCGYTILDAHGTGEPEMGIHLSVVDQKDGDYQAAHGWQESPLLLTSATVPKLVKGHGTLISLGCESGNQPLTDAFLESGCDAYIAPTGDRAYPDADAVTLFVAGFFYFAMSGDRDHSTASYSDEEATVRASAIDADFMLGTALFRRHRREPMSTQP